VGSSRKRGPNKQAPWSRNPDDGVSVLRLALDTSDSEQRAQLERVFGAAFSIRRAVQRDARDRCRAFWAAQHERSRDPKAARDRLGLSRAALEHAAYEHLDAAPHLRRSLTKALAMHLADSVWTATERHLFRDTKGKRQGLLHVGKWHDFARLPGRARSHTKARKWETFRLHGTLAGHRAAYADEDGDFVQPRHLRAVESDSWWNHDGALVIVCSGLADGELVLPVRLPTAPSNQPILDHHLADATRWHKVDLVRRRDPNVVGGWRYEAHLMVLAKPYVSPTAAARRARAAIEHVDRVAGIDVNVSNVTVVSRVADREFSLSRIERDATQRASDRKRTRRDRRRQRALDRSRRAANRAQYQLSKRQAKRARRREQAKLPPVDVIPMGPRHARSDGVPLQSYRRDVLTKSYHHLRAARAAEADRAARVRRDRARQWAVDVIAQHGYRFVVEDCNITAWSTSWGGALAAFSPGTLVTAIDREARAVAELAGASGGVSRAATRTTALSQHCPCSARVSKRLADREHRCAQCGLVGDRDAIAATLASFVSLEADVPTSARVDYEASRNAQPAIQKLFHSSYEGWQDTLSESNDHSAREGVSLSWLMSTPDDVAVARRNVSTAACPTLDETGASRTKPDRSRLHPDMCRLRAIVAALRDTS
jgi:hypothetical protein